MQQAACDKRIEAHARRDAHSTRLRALAGIGPLTADAVVATVGSAREFNNGRQMAAWLGRISCRGDGYLRTLLIQGAHSTLQQAKRITEDQATPEQLWIRDLAGRLPFGTVLVAIANKHARQVWVMLAHDVDYDPCAGLNHPM